MTLTIKLKEEDRLLMDLLISSACTENLSADISSHNIITSKDIDKFVEYCMNYDLSKNSYFIT